MFFLLQSSLVTSFLSKHLIKSYGNILCFNVLGHFSTELLHIKISSCSLSLSGENIKPNGLHGTIS